MTFEFYKKLSIILFLLIALMYLLKAFLGYNEWSFDKNQIFKAMFYAPTILSLICLYFSVYAYLSKVELVKNSRRQITTVGIIFSLICVVYSLTPGFWGYLSSLKSKRNNVSLMKLMKIEDIYLDENGMAQNKFEAQLYYRKNNKLVKYFDKNRNEFLYSPDKSDRLFLQNRQQIEILNRRHVLIEKSVINLVAINITSFLLFIVLLLYLRKIKGNW